MIHRNFLTFFCFSCRNTVFKEQVYIVAMHLNVLIPKKRNEDFYMYVLCTVIYQIQWSKYHLPVYMRFITIIKKDKAIIFWEITTQIDRWIYSIEGHVGDTALQWDYGLPVSPDQTLQVFFFLNVEGSRTRKYDLTVL